MGDLPFEKRLAGRMFWLVIFHTVLSNCIADRDVDPAAFLRRNCNRCYHLGVLLSVRLVAGYHFGN